MENLGLNNTLLCAFLEDPDTDVEEEMVDLFNSDNSDSDSIISSSNDNLSDDDSDDNLVSRRELTRIKNFIEVIQNYDNLEFKEHFRLSRETCMFLIEKVSSAGVVPTHVFGREIITPSKSVYMTLWYLGNKETYRQISDRFDVTKSAAYNCIRRIVEYLVQISPNFIKWPETEEDKQEIVTEFERRQGIRGILGAIDGCHINIRKPIQDPHVYCNRKGDFSILLQGVAKHNKMFTDIFCGEAGSIHDSRMLKRSALYRKCNEGLLLQNGLFLLGDSAYPNLRWLVPPFKDNGHLTRQHKIFNYRHSSSRIVIENAFGLLKGRFRRLQYFETLNIQLIVQFVVAACVLHNICIQFDDNDMDYFHEEPVDQEISNQYYEDFTSETDTRHEIFNAMFRN